MRALCTGLYRYFCISLLQLLRKSWRSYKVTSLVLLLVTGFFLSMIGKMHIVFSAEDLAGEGLASADELQNIKERYQDGISSVLILRPSSGMANFSVEQLCGIRLWYSNLRVTTPELKGSLSSFDFLKPTSPGPNRISYHNFIDLDCHTKHLEATLDNIKKELNQSPFALAEDRSQDFSLSFQFTFEDSKTSKFGHFDPKYLDHLRQSVATELQTQIPGIRAFWVGPADYQWSILEGFKFSKFVNGGMLLFLLLGLRLLFGSWKLGLIFTGSLILSGIWLFGLKGTMGSSYDLLASGLFVMLGLSSLEDICFVSGEMAAGKSWRRAVAKMAIPGFFTSFTTILGFLSLAFSEIAAIRRMGIWAAWGAIVEWMMIFLFLPAVLKFFPKFQSWVKVEKSHGMNTFRAWTKIRTPRILSLLAVFVFPISYLAIDNFDFNEAPHRVFPAKQEFSQSLQELKKSKGWQGSASVVFDQATSDQDLTFFIKTLNLDPTIQAQVARMESSSIVIDWLNHFQLATSSNNESLVHNSTMNENFLDAEARPRIILYVKDTAVQPIQELKKSVATLCGNRCHLAGEIVAYSDFSSLAPRSLVESLISSLILVGLTIWFLSYVQGKEQFALKLCVSAFWGPCVMLSLLGLMNVTLDFWKSIFASILVGLTGDNAIQYLLGSRKLSLHHGIQNRGIASIQTGLLMAGTSFIYLGSYFNPPRVFGLILGFGILAALAGDLWLLNSFLELKSFKNLFTFRVKK